MDKHRYDGCTIDCTSDCGHCKGRRFGPFAHGRQPIPDLLDINDEFVGNPRCQSIDPTGYFQCAGRYDHLSADHGGPHPHDVGLPSWRDYHLVKRVRWEDDSVPTGGLSWVRHADPDPGDERGGQVVAVWALLAVALVCAAVVAVVVVGVARGWFW